MKIFLVDLKNDIVGHYHIMKCLNSLPQTEEINTCEKKYKFKESPIRFFKQRYKIVKHTMRSINEQYNGMNAVVHYLTADKFYFLFWLFPGKLKGKKIVATIHRVPRNKILQRIMLSFSNRVDAIIVLSNYLREELQQFGISNVYTVEHPSFYDYTGIRSKEELRNANNISNDKMVISFLGGMRYEKGIDIFLNAFKYLDESYKEKILVNIAGEEKEIKSSFILQQIKELNIIAKCNFKRLSDEEFMENVVISDYIVTPYRKTFNGMSGLLAEALSQGIGCIVPNTGILGHYGRLFDSHLTFKSENPRSLANSILYCLKQHPTISQECRLIFQKETFITNMQRIYYSLLKT